MKPKSVAPQSTVMAVDRKLHNTWVYIKRHWQLYLLFLMPAVFVFNAMRTYNLFPFLVQVPVATLITRRYFKETGSIYLGSFTIAMLYTMMQVTQVSTNLGLIP